MIRESEYIKIIKKGESLPTILSFSSLDTKSGTFKPYNILLNEDANIVFINGKGNTWYQDGIIGVSDNPEEAASSLVKYAREIGNGRAVTFGSSMGAYGAILYGILGKADGCYTFGPEIKLNMLKSRTEKYLPPIDIKFPDLRLLNSNNDIPIIIYASEHDEIDLISISQVMDQENVKVFPVNGCTHPGIKRELVVGCVARFAKTGAFPMPDHKNIDVDLINELYKLYCNKESSNFDGYLHELQVLNEKTNGENFLVMLRLAEELKRLGNSTTSNNLYKEIISKHPYSFEAYEALGDSTLNSLEERIAYLQNAITINPTGRLQLKVARVAFENMDYDLSYNAYIKAVKVYPNDSNVCKEYETVKSILNK